MPVTETSKIAHSNRDQALQPWGGMDDADFDGMIARAADPTLIPGIYNYCDRRCARCAFTSRCFQYRETERAGEVADDVSSVGRVVARSLERSMDILRIIGRRLGIDLVNESANDGASSPETPRAGAGPPKTFNQDDDNRYDPLVQRSRDYATTAWPILRALRPVLEVRGETPLLDALTTLESSSISISSKIFRAVSPFPEVEDHHPEDPEDDVQSDANGSAKVARILIEEARRAWRTLMAPGQATADGVPARLVRQLDELDDKIAARFPRAMEFVRPGFDTERPAA